MLSDFLSGNGSSADFINAFPTFARETTSYDAADNGAVTQGAGQTTVEAPAWLQGLQSVLGVANEGAALVGSITGGAAKPNIAPPAKKPAAKTGQGKWIILGVIGAAVVGVIVWLLARK